MPYFTVPMVATCIQWEHADAVVKATSLQEAIEKANSGEFEDVVWGDMIDSEVTSLAASENIDEERPELYIEGDYS